MGGHLYAKGLLADHAQARLVRQRLASPHRDLPLAHVELPIAELKKTDRTKVLEAALKAVPGVRAGLYLQK